ncbi:MAG: hypothetical protein M1814_003671 [Vezdaea aestivalis]|nr:MAG: hypothetical protein M1814_003671 [Vezdaea aestivalis]
MNKYTGTSDVCWNVVYPIVKKMSIESVAKVKLRLIPQPTPKQNPGNSNLPVNETPLTYLGPDTRFDHDRCMRALLLTNPSDDLSTIRRHKGRRSPGTCEWILANEEYIQWLSSPGLRLLRLFGNPGIGKTMMSSFLVDELGAWIKKQANSSFGYYFCDDKDERRNTDTAIIRGLLLQMLEQTPDLLRYLEAEFKRQDEKLFDNFEALWRIFVTILRTTTKGTMVILIDALDECSKASRDRFLDAVSEFLTTTPIPLNVKFLVTSRTHTDVSERLVDFERSIHIDSKIITRDLMNYIDDRVADLIRRKEYLSLVHKEKIVKFLKKGAGATFLWVSLVLEDLNTIDRPSLIDERLQKMPKNLDELYDGILSQIDEDSEDVARATLFAMVAARRPFTKAELATILFLRKYRGEVPNPVELEDFLREYRSCKSMLYVDEIDRTVNMLHQSVKDYLTGSHLRNHPSLSRFSMSFDDAHFSMFEIGWLYMNSRHFEHGKLLLSHIFFEEEKAELSPSSESIAKSPSLSNKDKGRSSVQTSQEQDQSVHQSSKNVPQSESAGSANRSEPCAHDQWVISREAQSSIRKGNPFLEYAELYTASHGASACHLSSHKYNWIGFDFRASCLKSKLLIQMTHFGCEHLVRLLLANGADTTTTDELQMTALYYAVFAGIQSTIELLLDAGADTAVKDSRGMTVLLTAATCGKIEIFKSLLQRAFNAGARAENQTSVSKSSTTHNHEEKRIILLQMGINIEETGSTGFTALQVAAGLGHGAILELLLQLGSNLDAEYDHGRTALHLAATVGQETTTKLLLQNGADSKATTDAGDTVLHLAVSKGHESTTRLLLQMGADIEATEKHGFRALHIAASKGYETTTRLLLQMGADIEATKKHGFRALHVAVSNGHETMIELLLQMGADVGATTEDTRFTALQFAVDQGHEATARLLLSAGANIGQTNRRGETALNLAVDKGHTNMVKLLLESSRDTLAKAEAKGDS